jgi:hypothetical protein
MNGSFCIAPEPSPNQGDAANREPSCELRFSCIRHSRAGCVARFIRPAVADLLSR